MTVGPPKSVVLDVDHREVVLTAVQRRVDLEGAGREEGTAVVLSVPADGLRSGRPDVTQHAVGGKRRVEVDTAAADHDLVHTRHAAHIAEGPSVVDQARIAAEVAGEHEGGDRGSRRGQRDAEGADRRVARRLEEEWEAGKVEGHATLDVGQLARTAQVGRDGVVIKRRHPIGVEETPLVAVREPAVGVHPTQVELVAIAVAGDGEHRRKHGPAVAAREQGQVIREDAPGDVGGRGHARADRGIPGGNRRPLRRAEVVRVGQGDVGADRAVSVRREGEAGGTKERDVVDARRRRGVVARDISARHAAGRDGVRSGQLLGAGRDLALRTRPLTVAAETGCSRNILVTDGSCDQTRVPHEDVGRALSDRARPDVDHLAGIHESLDQSAAHDQAAAVRADPPLGVRAVARRAVRPEVLAAGGPGADRRHAEQDQREPQRGAQPPRLRHARH